MTHALPRSEATARTSRLVDAIALLIAIGSGLALLWANTSSLYNLRRLDVLSFYLPWYQELGERLRAFDLPGWMPYTLSGVPFAGDPQSGWAYLPAMVAFTISPDLTGYNLFLGFHVVLAAAGTYLYARVIGMRAVGALMASVAFTFGNLTERIACCTIHLEVAVWIPTVYLAFEMMLRATTRRAQFGWLILAGFCTGQMMAGWIGQGAYYGALAVTAYAIVRLLMHHDGPWHWSTQIKQLMVGGLVAGVIAAATVAPALIPRLDTISRSNLADLYTTGDSARASGWEWQTFVRELFSYESGTSTTYLGLVLLVLMVAGAVAFGRRPRMPFFIALFLIGLSLILVDSPIEKLFALLPRFDALHIHQPDRVLIVLFLPPAIAAGWLIDGITEPDRTRRPRTLLAAWAVVIAGLALVGIDIVMRNQYRTALNDERLRVALLALVLIGIGLLIPRRWIGYPIAIALILLMMWDPAVNRATGRADSSFTQRSRAAVDAYTEVSDVAAWIKAQETDGNLFRYFGYDQLRLVEDGELRTYHIFFSERGTYRLLVNNISIPAEIQDIQGYNPVQIQRYVEYFDAINQTDQSYHASNVLMGGLDSPLLQMLGVRYIVVPREIPTDRPDLLHLSQRLPTVFTNSVIRVLEYPNPFPRAWLVHNVVAMDSEADILQAIDAGQMDPRTTAGIVGRGPVMSGTGSGNVTVTSYGADEIRLSVETDAVGMVVLSEIWDPGWTATVDGQATEIYAANGVFRGIVVGPGTHEIVVSYPATVAKVSLLAWLVPLLALLALALPVWGRSRSRAGALVPLPVVHQVNH